MKTLLLSTCTLLTFFIGNTQTKVRVQTFNGFSDTVVKAKLDSAVKLIEVVVNSKEFGDKVANAKYLRKRHKTSIEILNLIRTGCEEGTQQDSTINLKVDVYDDKKHEIGNTDDDNITHTNKDYILENGAACYAAHLIHEYLHVLGFSHAGWRMPFRSKTVPYKVGNFAAEVLNAVCP